MKSARPSLTGQLLVRLVVAQALIYVAALLVWMVFSPYVSYADLAGESAKHVVISAVTVDERGALVLAQTPELRDYAAARPDFVYAAIAGDRILPGSSPKLAAALQRFAPYVPKVARLDMESAGLSGRLRLDTVPDRDLVVATAGNQFHLDDVPAFFSVYAPAMMPMLGPALGGALIVVPIVVRRSLRRLRGAGRAAGAIDLRSLDRRLPAEGLPREVAPFVETINGLLDRLEDGLRHQRRFTANAAHELRTPVAILRARVDGMPDSPVKQSLSVDCQRLAVLVDQLLSAARLEQREVEVDEDVDLIVLLRDLVADCAPVAIRSGRTIELLCGLDAATVRGNGRALRSATANLIDNALRAEPEGGLVEVILTGDHSAGVARIEIVDHGPGIPPSDATLIFEPFWRKDEHKPGTGLGLSIVREIAVLHGGSVTHRPTAGGGATFAIELPARDMRAGRAEAALHGLREGLGPST